MQLFSIGLALMNPDGTVQLDRHGTGWAGELRYMEADLVTDSRIKAGEVRRTPYRPRSRANFSP